MLLGISNVVIVFDMHHFGLSFLLKETYNNEPEILFRAASKPAHSFIREKKHSLHTVYRVFSH